MKSTTIARIQLTIEVTGSSYGEEWNLGEIIKQASSETQNNIENILSKFNVVVIGKPLVKTITTMQIPS